MNLTSKEYKYLANSFNIPAFIRDSSAETLKTYLDFNRLTQQARQDLLLNQGLMEVFFKDQKTDILASLDNNYLVSLYRRIVLNDEEDFLADVVNELNTRSLNYTNLCRLFLVKHRSWKKVHTLSLLSFKPVDIVFISSTVGLQSVYRDIVVLCSRDLVTGSKALQQLIDKLSDTITNKSKNRISSEYRSYAIIMKSLFTPVHIDLATMQTLANLYTAKTAISLVAKSISHLDDDSSGYNILGESIVPLVNYGLISGNPEITVSHEALEWAIMTHTASVLSGSSKPIVGRLSKNIETIRPFTR